MNLLVSFPGSSECFPISVTAMRMKELNQTECWSLCKSSSQQNMKIHPLHCTNINNSLNSKISEKIEMKISEKSVLKPLNMCHCFNCNTKLLQHQFVYLYCFKRKLVIAAEVLLTSRSASCPQQWSVKIFSNILTLLF